MARQARKRSSTGIYHVMLRGIDKRDIFLDDKDKERFIACIIKAKEVGKFELYGYCLMNNHVHLLIKEIVEEIGTSIKRITVGYVGWHNNKYERVGHLFQNRYKSEPVETEDYLLTVLRYIHQNPVKAKLVNEIEDYCWSSYKQFLLLYQNGKYSSFIDTQFIKNYFTQKKDFVSYMNAENDDESLEYKSVKKYNDDTLEKIIYEEYAINNFATLPIEERNRVINKIYNDLDVSIRQLSRVLDIGKAVIERAIKSDR